MRRLPPAGYASISGIEVPVTSVAEIRQDARSVDDVDLGVEHIPRAVRYI